MHDSEYGDPFAGVTQEDPFPPGGSVSGGLGGEDLPSGDGLGEVDEGALREDGSVRPAYEPAREPIAGSLGGEDAPPAETDPDGGDPEQPDEQPAPETESAPAAKGKRGKRFARDGEGEAKTRPRTYVVFEQGELEDGRPFYWVVTRVQARNATHALRQAHQQCYSNDPIGTQRMVTVVPESMWRHVPIERYEREPRVGVKIG